MTRTPEQIVGKDRLLQLIFEGYVVVPHEPTVDMFEAAWREAQVIAREAGGSMDKDRVIDCTDRYWRAMVGAVEPAK